MEEKSLKITGADKTFFNRITNTITKILIPTRIGINGMLITAKRNSLLKAFDNSEKEEASDKKEAALKKYEDAYTAYLEALDKYVLDSIYKKVKNNTASDFEKTALSNYYSVIRLKENEYVEYKNRKQKYLIELDKESVELTNKEKIIDRYNKFYVSKMDTLYKAILKNYSIKLADTTNIYDSSKEWLYLKIFSTLQDYLDNILSIKVTIDTKLAESIKEDYEKYQSLTVGKLDTRDYIEKNMYLIAISRKLFTHSLPLVVAEQCYMKLLKDARSLVQDTKIANKRERAYTMLIDLMEEYNSKLVSTKVYWSNSKDREEFKQFWNRYKEIQTLKETDYMEYVKQKEVLFIKNDLKNLRSETTDYTRLIKYYKRKLIDYNVMKELKGYKSEGKYIKKKEVA